jgi:hypothetical protein
VSITQYYDNNHRKEKCKCLVYDGSNKEVFFEMYVKFEVVCEMLELTTGDKLFDNFYHCLDGTALIKFKQAADGKPRNVAGFSASS